MEKNHFASLPSILQSQDSQWIPKENPLLSSLESSLLHLWVIFSYYFLHYIHAYICVSMYGAAAQPFRIISIRIGIALKLKNGDKAERNDPIGEGSCNSNSQITAYLELDGFHWYLTLSPSHFPISISHFCLCIIGSFQLLISPPLKPFSL